MELQWELMVFTLFICLGAGVFAIQGLLSFLRKGSKIQVAALIISLIAIAIGGFGSFLHLHHWERLFNGFGHLSSGITQELIAIVVFIVALVVYLIMLRRSETELPKWCGIMAMIISVVLVFVMAHSYNMSARPIWDTPMLWLYYLSNAAFFGGLMVAILAGIQNDDSVSTLMKYSFIGACVQLIITILYSILLSTSSSQFTNVGYYFDPVHPNTAIADPQSTFTGIFAGDHALLFWFGVIVIGLIVPLILCFIARKKSGKQVAAYAALSLVCALIGGVCFRAILYILGFSVFMFY